MGTHLSRRSGWGSLIAVACFCALAVGADTGQSTTEPANDQAVGPPTSQSSPKYPVPYQAPTVAQITDVLERVRMRIDTAASPRFVDRRTKREVTDVSKPVANLILDAGPTGEFNPVSYPMGVIHNGMLSAAEATGDPKFTDYTAKWFTFYANNLPVLAKWPRRSLAPPVSSLPVTAATTQEAADEYAQQQADLNGGGGRNGGGNYGGGRRGGRGGGGRTDNPLRALLAPNSLDDCGAMVSSMIKFRMANIGPDMKPVIDRAIAFVSKGQFRLPDGTLARHRPVRESVWADDMYMGVNILAQAGKLTGDKSYYDDAAKQVLQIGERLYVPKAQLFTHGWNSANPDDHPTYFWGRANGWCMMAMAELLTVLPEDNPARPAVLKQFRTLAQGIASVQAGDGLWHQMLDRPDTYTETSCSGMFVFAIARGVNQGWLDFATYGPVAQAGWNGLAARVDKQGHITGTCVGTSYANDYVYYYHRPSVDDVHGYGPMLLAGAEMIRLMKNPKFFSNNGPNNGAQVQFVPRSPRSGDFSGDDRMNEPATTEPSSNGDQPAMPN